MSELSSPPSLARQVNVRTLGEGGGCHLCVSVSGKNGISPVVYCLLFCEGGSAIMTQRGDKQRAVIHLCRPSSRSWTPTPPSSSHQENLLSTSYSFLRWTHVTQAVLKLYITVDDLELPTLQPLSSKGWNYRCALVLCDVGVEPRASALLGKLPTN